MKDKENLHRTAMNMLLKTSRTFFIPITYLGPGLQEAVTSAYLSMRAIDEIEDHEELPQATKISLLRSISDILTQPSRPEKLKDILGAYESLLPEVTLKLDKWIELCPTKILPNIMKATSIMAEGMAKWVDKQWVIKTKEDLDDYTFYVAGLVGILLSEVWEWHDSIKSDKELAIAFGRGLQAVNIIRNREEDLARGVDFFPEGWSRQQMIAYAEKNLSLAEKYCEAISNKTIYTFCKIPLALAFGTLKAIKAGKEKLSRSDVKDIVESIT